MYPKKPKARKKTGAAKSALRTEAKWTFLTNHAFVLYAVSQEPGIRIADLARQVGITERAVLRIIEDLVRAEYLTRLRSGRRNSYQLNHRSQLRHPLSQELTISEFLGLWKKKKRRSEKKNGSSKSRGD